MVDSRNKGARIEREILSQLGEDLGLNLHRNLDQTFMGGADCYQVPRHTIEIKGRKTFAWLKWWDKLLRDTTERNPIPVLIFRADGRTKPFFLLDYDAGVEYLRGAIE